MNSLDHVFNILFVCRICDETQHIEGNIEGILGTMQESGWPICPECEGDMERSTVTAIGNVDY